MKKVVYRLSEAAARKATLSGEKGASLAKLMVAGLPVPDGFVVTTELFQSVVGDLPAVRKLKEHPPANHAARARASANVRKAILASEVPEDVHDQIGKAFKGKGAVSARSSSTAEDLEEASFAGQYDSFLNIHTLDDLIGRIKDVWVSLYSSHAVDYRHRNKIPFENASMAVVVQRQLAPESAGVMFTRDPVSGKNRFVVTAALGLGEGVVAGTAETDHFELDPKTGKVLTVDIAAKTARVVATETGGIETVTVTGDRGEKPALTARQLKALAAFGRKLVQMGKGPQDIEFAVTGGKVQILQARAMTALDEEIEPEEPWGLGLNKGFTWHRRRGPSYRLEEELVREQTAQSRICYEETGSSMTYRSVSHFSNGYQFARSNKHSAETLAKLHARQTRRVNASLRKGKSYFEDVIQGMIERRHAELKVQRAAVVASPDLVTYLESCIKMSAWVGGNLHWRQGKPGGRPDWPKLFHEVTGEPALDAHVHTLGVQNRMTRLLSRIRELARIARGDRVLKRLLLERRFDDLGSARVKDRPAGNLFWKRFRSMLHIYGQRNGSGYGSSLDFAAPTWNLDWSLPFEVIASYVEQDLDKVERLGREARAERIRATQRIRRKLAGSPKKLKQFNQGVAEAVIGVRFLEDHNYYMEQCSRGIMREAMHEVGAQLVERDLIEHADEVIHFSLDELRAIASDPDAGDQRALVRERERQYALRRKMKPPETLGRPPKKEEEKKEEDKRGVDGHVIRGAAASAGRIKGRALVILPGKLHPKVHPGDILVARNVGPDWTPTFHVIGGLVLDEGSLGQHAALVARECRIPSVMMTKEASKVIKTGQIITVDGNNGIVEL